MTGLSDAHGHVTRKVGIEAVAPSPPKLSEIADPDRIAFGSDFPYARFPEDDLVDMRRRVAAFPVFDAVLHRKVERNKAAKLFP